MAVTHHNGRTFDRIFQPDARNDAFRLKVVEPETVAKAPPASKAYTREIWLDQGAEGGCTGYSAAQTLSLAPRVNNKIVAANAEYFYFEAKQYDEYKGDDYEGSSVLGAQKALLALKYTTGYNWAATVEEIIAALAFKSSVQLGINWYQSMFDVSAEGVISIASGSAVAGGHAINAAAYKGGGDLIRLDNTWGKGWGKMGSAWISATDLSRLLSEDGEAAIPVKALHLPSPMGTHARVDPNT